MHKTLTNTSRLSELRAYKGRVGQRRTRTLVLALHGTVASLINVVDLSGPAAWDELRMLKEELEKCKPGMSARARMVIANKAGLLGGDGNPEEVRLARAKLARTKTTLH